MRYKHTLKGQWSVLLLLSIATAIELLDGTAVNISLPTMADYYSVDISTVSLIPLVYFLVISCLLLPFAKIIEKYGTRNIIGAGLFLFTASSYLCAVSPDIKLLIMFRCLQATGGAMMAAGVPAQVATGFPSEVRGKVLGVIMGAGGIALAAGPAIGGYITHFLSWHWIFYINIPIGIFGMALTMYAVEDSRIKSSLKNFDYAGVVTLCAAMTSFLVILSQGSSLGWSSPATAVLFFLFVVFAVLFAYCEKRHSDPIIDIDIFKNPGFSGSVVFLVIFEILLGGVEFILPFYLESVLGMTPDISGLYLLIPPLIMIIAGPAGGSISDYEGNRLVCSTAGFLAAVSFVILFLSLGNISANQIYLVIGLIVFGISIGTVASSGANRIIEQCPEDHRVTGSAVSNLVFYVGMSMGTAVYTLIVQESLASEMPGITDVNSISAGLIPPGILTSAMHQIYLFSFLLAVGAMIISLLIRDREVIDEP
ncbi:DHA2 family metal-tetracycline-proton antiporter-like MFS transporter [Methanomicrobium sp. W14]|uniref:MFS transporter n=1 Tax=Methanomicrobium sp. W14 TaxID=2817839 RepID=UPI001AEB403C|nr:MFS transporter [Methanomicrobium sp. W14]MBP2133175.1 DHA2 family metal-tetracycline-proton antiporter-like MFS transporter [Methanomicrobium sp. W14]